MDEFDAAAWVADTAGAPATPSAPGTSGTPGAAGATGTCCASATTAAGAASGGGVPGDVLGVVAQVQALVAEMAGAVAADRVSGGDLLELGEVLATVIIQAQALHSSVTAQVVSSGMWAVAGYPSAQGWLRISQRLDGRSAARATTNAAWLGEHTVVRRAFEAGAISLAHVDAIRRVAASTPARREAFPRFAGALVQAASATDPARLGQVMRAWADVVDDEGSNRDAEDDHEARRVFLSPVGEGWDLRGWLPAAQGAELAGILNEITAAARREDPTNTDPAPARRADALLDLARAAAAAGLQPAQRDRAKITVLLPYHQLRRCTDCRRALPADLLASLASHTNDPDSAGSASTSGGNPNYTNPECRYRCGPDRSTGGTGGTGDPGCPSCTRDPGDPGSPGDPGDPGEGCPGGSGCPCRAGQQWEPAQSGGTRPPLHAATWRCGNGPGDGILSSSDVDWLTCDGQIQRIVLSPASAPLDVGRATRVIPPAIRTALDIRDGGCIIPDLPTTPRLVRSPPHPPLDRRG